METHETDAFLQSFIEENKEVAIYLVNGLKFTGFIKCFDGQSVILRSTQLIFRHAISTVQPAR